MSIQRPDKGPSGPSEGRLFSVVSFGEIGLQNYPNFKHFAVRVLLVRVNHWYGSLFEMHLGERGKGFEFDYFDMLFLRYAVKKRQAKSAAKARVKAVKPKTENKVVSAITAPWHMIDQTIKTIVELPLWEAINKAVPTASSISKRKNKPRGL